LSKFGAERSPRPGRSAAGILLIEVVELVGGACGVGFVWATVAAPGVCVGGVRCVGGPDIGWVIDARDTG
jgi:hypothetical protein